MTISANIFLENTPYNVNKIVYETDRTVTVTRKKETEMFSLIPPPKRNSSDADEIWLNRFLNTFAAKRCKGFPLT